MFLAGQRWKLLIVGMILFAPRGARGADWPAWRHDSQRSAASPQELPSDLKLQWSRRLPRLKPAWPDQLKMRFDVGYEPIVVGDRLYFGSSFDNSVRALSTRDGAEVWRFYADGPVRFAPLAWEGHLYVVSDDGFLYCLKADDGSLVWRFRGGPSDRKILGNERMISTWPARGAPVIADGVLYFAAGIWPFMGTFLHAIDARTGTVVWTNDGDGSTYMKQPHNADSFAGVAPQGFMVVNGDKLLVAGGRSVPACYDRKTGKLLYYELAENGHYGGGSAVASVDQLIFNGAAAFDLKNEKFIAPIGEQLTFADGRYYDCFKGELRVLDLSTSKVVVEDVVDRKGRKVKVAKWSILEMGTAKAPALTALIKSGSRLVAGAENRLLMWPAALPKTGGSEPSWQAEIKGTPSSLISADDRLFVTTLQGDLLCFGSAPTSTPVTHGDRPAAPNAAPTTIKASGYALVAGADPIDRILGLASNPDLRLVVVEPTPTKANALRRKLSDDGIGAEKITVLVGDLSTLPLPPYFATAAMVDQLPMDSRDRQSLLGKVFGCLRPFGGTAYLNVPTGEMEALKILAQPLQLEKAEWKPWGDRVALVRSGALPDSADWTHEHADAANTRVSRDKRVKAPLGLLWFGGPPNDAVLPRHGHGPQPQVVDGRLFIEGMDVLRSTDIYTGRLLWEASLPGVGKFYDNTSHQPGANATGTNYIATHEGVFVAYKDRCVQLDPATGAVVAEFALPQAAGGRSGSAWGYLNVMDDYLIGGGEPLYDKEPRANRSDNDNFSSSARLVVIDRRSKKTLWTANARIGFRHNAICAGGGKLFAIDRLSGPQLSRLKRRGEEPKLKSRLLAFDLKSGKELWSTEKEVFGTWLSYSAERDVLVESGRNARDTLSDEPKGMRAYRGDGTVLWNQPTYTGPAMLHHSTILMAGNACDLLTGQLVKRQHPLTGETMDWVWMRNYGCNTPMASENLLTFRSGAAGFFDYCNDGGTGNFGGFRSSCTNNLVVAGGLITAPDYTRTCTCSYQNQTSIAMVHEPNAEVWTSFGSQTPKSRIRQLGINLAAPGDRKADDGTLWLEYPSVGGPSPDVAIQTEPARPRWFRRHSSTVSGPGLSWVSASGGEGISKLTVRLSGTEEQAKPYTVRLHFSEPEKVNPGERAFRVNLQGKTVAPAIDVVQEAGGPNRSLVKEFQGVQIGQELVLELAAVRGSRGTILCGVELRSEGW